MIDARPRGGPGRGGRRGGGIREGGGLLDEQDEQMALDAMRGERPSRYSDEQRHWQREARKLGENPTAEQLAEVESYGWDAGQIVRLNRARRELGLSPVLRHRETVGSRERPGQSVPIQEEVASARSGPARNAILAELDDRDLADIVRRETEENRIRGNGRGRQFDRRKQSAYAKRERIIRDVQAEQERRRG